MSTRSFDIDMVLDTNEAMLNFIKAMEAADKRGPYKPTGLAEKIEENVALIPKKCPIVR